MGYALARHLLARTGFGGRPAEIDRFAGLSFNDGIDALLNSGGKQGLQRVAALSPPAFVEDPVPPARGTLSREQRKALRRRSRKQGLELQGWWLQQMVTTTSPLTERLTLMWHNHFTSSLRKARWPTLMWRQNATLRRLAAGSFEELLGAMLVDPAMLLYLDNQRNRAKSPNENLGRELLELFTLGQGNYTERDIKETARALTGFGVNRRSGLARLRPRAHDDGTKTILGHSGNFGLKELPKLLTEHQALAPHIAKRVYREFVGTVPSKATLRSLVKTFRASNLTIKALLAAVLRSEAFRAPAGFGSIIRSPAELLVSTLRVLDLPVRDWTAVAQASRRLGQHLFQPPNVKGWPGGTAWVNAPTLLARQAALRRALRGMNLNPMSWEQVSQWLGTEGTEMSQGAMVAAVSTTLLPIEPLTSPPLQKAESPLKMFERLLLDPTYQLK